MTKREKDSKTWGKRKKRKDLKLNKLKDNAWLTDRLPSLMRFKIMLIKSWTNKLQKLKTKQIAFSRSRRRERRKWRQQLIVVANFRFNARTKRRWLQKRKKRTLLISGVSVMTSCPWLSNKKRRKTDNAHSRSQTSLSSSTRWKTKRKFKSSFTIKKLLRKLKPFSTNKKRTSTLMLSSASVNGKPKAKMLSRSSWNLKTTKSA